VTWESKDETPWNTGTHNVVHGRAILEAVRREDKDMPFSLERDLPALVAAIQELKATLVVIDPLSAYLGKPHVQGRRGSVPADAPLGRCSEVGRASCT
jgi:hypothetical protein